MKCRIIDVQPHSRTDVGSKSMHLGSGQSNTRVDYPLVPYQQITPDLMVANGNALRRIQTIRNTLGVAIQNSNLVRDPVPPPKSDVFHPHNLDQHRELSPLQQYFEHLHYELDEKDPISKQNMMDANVEDESEGDDDDTSCDDAAETQSTSTDDTGAFSVESSSHKSENNQPEVNYAHSNDLMGGIGNQSIGLSVDQVCDGNKSVPAVVNIPSKSIIEAADLNRLEDNHHRENQDTSAQSIEISASSAVDLPDKSHVTEEIHMAEPDLLVSTADQDQNDAISAGVSAGAGAGNTNDGHREFVSMNNVPVALHRQERNAQDIRYGAAGLDRLLASSAAAAASVATVVATRENQSQFQSQSHIDLSGNWKPSTKIGGYGYESRSNTASIDDSFEGRYRRNLHGRDDREDRDDDPWYGQSQSFRGEHSSQLPQHSHPRHLRHPTHYETRINENVNDINANYGQLSIESEAALRSRHFGIQEDIAKLDAQYAPTKGNIRIVSNTPALPADNSQRFQRIGVDLSYRPSTLSSAGVVAAAGVGTAGAHNNITNRTGHHRKQFPTNGGGGGGGASVDLASLTFEVSISVTVLNCIDIYMYQSWLRFVF